MSFDCESVQKILNYSFKNPQLLITAFTHKSYHGSDSTKNNERLEFLGDSLLGFVVADYLYRNNKIGNEGKMTQIKQQYVSTKPLSNVIRCLGLHEFIIQGESLRHLAASNDRLLENLFEALVAALYLDGGFEIAKKFIKDNLLSASVQSLNDGEDYKSQLQIYTQSKKLGVPIYELVEKTGPDHNPQFTISVCIDGKIIAVGTGRNKSVASQDAARNAIKKLFRQE